MSRMIIETDMVLNKDKPNTPLLSDNEPVNS